jgi:tetratricopeptide (TPR) repeat protein
MVRAGGGDLLWSKTYEKTLAEIGTFEQQLGDELTEVITGRRPSRSAPAAHHARASAQDAYFRGWAEIEGYSRQTTANAVRWFQQAIAEDPDYALAHAGLSHAYYTAGYTFKLYPRDEARTLAKSAALRALEIDPALARAQAALGMVQMYFEWSWREAEESLSRAVLAAPNDGRIRYQYAAVLAATGRVQAALEEIRKVIELDPASRAARIGLGSNLYYARRYSESIAAYEQLLREDPNLRPPHLGIAKSLIMLGDFARAVAEIELARYKDEPAVLVDVARAEALRGNHEAARALVEKLRDRVEAGQLAPDYLAAAHLALGEREEALDLLSRAVAERSPSVVWLQVDPRFDDLRTDTRFAALLRSVGFER